MTTEESKMCAAIRAKGGTSADAYKALMASRRGESLPSLEALEVGAKLSADQIPVLGVLTMLESRGDLTWLREVHFDDKWPEFGGLSAGRPIAALLDGNEDGPEAIWLTYESKVCTQPDTDRRQIGVHYQAEFVLAKKGN